MIAAGVAERHLTGPCWRILTSFHFESSALHFGKLIGDSTNQRAAALYQRFPYTPLHWAYRSARSYSSYSYDRRQPTTMCEPTG